MNLYLNTYLHIDHKFLCYGTLFYPPEYTGIYMHTRGDLTRSQCDTQIEL